MSEVFAPGSEPEAPPTPGTNGSGDSGYLTAEQIEKNAPADIIERDVEGVFGGKVRIRSLTAAQAAKVQQAGVKMTGQQGRNVQISLPDAEVMKFQLGVVKPELDHNAVMRLYQNSGPSFQKVNAEIDDISGIDADELERAKAAFQGSDEE